MEIQDKTMYIKFVVALSIILCYFTKPIASTNDAEIIISSTQTFHATLFPFEIKRGILLIYEDANDRHFDFPTFTVRVYNGSLIPSNPFPGLYINNKNRTCIEVTGPIEDIQLWIESSRNSIDHSSSRDEYVIPGGGIRYMPPYYDWIGRATVHFWLAAPNQDDDINNVEPISNEKVEISVNPLLVMKLKVISQNQIVHLREDESMRPFHHDSNGTVISIESVARKQWIKCFLESSVGKFDRPQINGTVSTIPGSLAGVEYIPKQNFNGKVTLTITCHNIKDNQSDEVTVEMNVLPVNDPPSILMHPGPVETWEDATMQLGPYTGLNIVDVDARESDRARIAVDLTVSRGRAELHQPPSELLGGLYVTANSSKHIQLIGHIDKVNRALQFLVLSFHRHWHGQGALLVRCTDEVEFGSKPFEVLYGNWISANIDFVVKSVNDKPIININTTVFNHVVEGDTIFFKNEAIAITDVDSRNSDVLNFTLQIYPVNGVIPGRIAVEENSIGQNMVYIHQIQNPNWILYSTRANISTLSFYIESMRLILREDWFGVCHECIRLQVTDIEGGSTEEKLTFMVQSIDDTPSIKLSTNMLISNEDQEILLSQVMNITVFDPDSLFGRKDIMYKMTIYSSKNGLIGLNKHISGCYISSGHPYAELESMLSFSGSMKVIQEAVNSLYYSPPENLDSFDFLYLKIEDDQALYDEVELQLRFKGLNDPPMISSNEVVKKIDRNGRPLLVIGFTIDDVDIHDESLSTTLTTFPVGVSQLGLPRLETSMNVQVNMNVTNMVCLVGDKSSINWILEEVFVYFNNVTSDNIVTVIAKVEDEDGLFDQSSIELNRGMNQRIPLLAKLNSTISMEEDTELYIGLIVDLQGAFDDSSIFEMKFECRQTTSDEKERPFLFGTLCKFKFVDLSLPGIHIPMYNLDKGSSREIIFSGNMKSLKHALEKLIVKPPTHYHGRFSVCFGIRAWSQSLFNDTYIFDTIAINVDSIDDAPVILWDNLPFINKNPIVTMDEDTFKHFGSRITVRDVDDNNQPLSVQINSSFGALCSHLKDSTYFSYINSFIFVDSTMALKYKCLKGEKLEMLITLEDLNEVLRTLAYKPYPNWWGIDEITFSITSNEIRTVTSIRIAVSPLYDETIIHVPNEILIVQEDSKYPISSITLSNHDTNPPVNYQIDVCKRFPQQCRLTVILEVKNGVLEAKAVGDAFLFYRQRKKIMLIHGTVDDINESLCHLMYEPDYNYVGDDLLNITASHISANSSVSDQVLIKVRGVNDGPILILPVSPSGFFEVWEDSEGIIGDETCIDDDNKSSLFITCQKITIADIDNTLEYNNTVTLSLFSENGFFKLPRLRVTKNVITSAQSPPWQNYTNHVELFGPIKELNWVLMGLIFRGKLNFNSKDSFEKLLIAVKDIEGNIANGTLVLKILPVNDEPVIIIEDQIYDYNRSTDDGIGYKRVSCKVVEIDEDTSFHVTGISIRDVDCSVSTEVMELTVSAYNGTVLFGNDVIMRQWVEGYRGKYYETITVRGTITNINEALQYLSYKPNGDFHGRDVIRIHVSDMGNVGVKREGREFNMIALSDTAEIPLIIRSIKDTPILIAPTYIKLEEDSSTVLEMSISHPDSDEALVQLDFECERGKIKFMYIEGLTFVNDTFNDAASVSVFGSIVAFQRSLHQVIFSPSENWNNHGLRPNAILISVRNFHEQEAINHVIKVDVTPLADPPRWHVPGGLTSLQHIGSIPTIKVLEDSSIKISPISITDDDMITTSHQCTLTVTISADNGVLKLAEYNGVFTENNLSRINFSASIDAVNRALDYLIYTPLPNFHGKDSITLEARDNGFIETVTIPIAVEAVPDVPIIKAPSTLICSEDEWCKLEVSIVDQDFYSELILDMSTNVGNLEFTAALTSPLVNIINGNNNTYSAFQSNGTAADLNIFLQRLTYLPALGSSKTIASIVITVSVPEDLSPSVMTSSRTISVVIIDSKNNSPSIRYDKAIYHDDPKCQSSYRPTSKIRGISSQGFCNNTPIIPPYECMEDLNCSLRGLSLNDPDSSKLRIILAVGEGTISVDSIAGIYVTQSEHQNHLDIVGELNQINIALGSLLYKSSKNYIGKDVIDIQISDINRSRVSHVFNMSIDIIISAVEDRIRFNGPHYMLHFQNEDELSILPSIKIDHENNIPSHNSVIVSATITANGGSIRFLSVQGLNITDPEIVTESMRMWINDNKHDGITIDNRLETNIYGSSSSIEVNKMSGMKAQWWKKISFCGSLGNINNALEHITFVGDKNTYSDANGLAEVEFGISKVDHCPATFLKNQKTKYDDTLSVVINVQPLNDAPIITAGKKTSDDRIVDTYYLHIDEDSQVAIPSAVDDVDDNIVKVDLSTCTSGYLSVTNKKPGHYNDILFLTGSSGDFYHHITMKGTIESLNGHLVNLIFKGENNYHGNDCVLTLTVCDNHESCNSRHIQIMTQPMHDPLILYMPVDHKLSHPLISVSEGSDVLIGSDWVNPEHLMMMKVQGQGGIRGDADLDLEQLIPGRAFSLSNINNNIQNDNIQNNNNNNIYIPETSSMVCLEITVSKGSIYFKELIPDGESDIVMILYKNQAEKGSSHFIVRGTIEGINEKIATNLIYHSIEGEVGHGQINIILSRNIECSQESIMDCTCSFESYDVKGSFEIFIIPMNAPPIIKWDNMIVIGNTPPLISVILNERINLESLQIMDMDVKETLSVDSHERLYYGFVTLTLSVTKGKLFFQQFSGVTLTQGDGVNDKEIQIMGDIENINKSLKYLEFQCSSKEIDSQLKITGVVDDEDNEDCQIGDSVQLSVHVNDNGFTGEGGTKESQLKIDIIIIL